ncbi:sentrin-specific protease 2-like [Hydra vulgaris]|uniref:Sentrin-specific protease 2-like n=1 Tax=Hydra vulgaris TaxID=6087 RepID=A0ABM4D6L8_HYDVU
MFYTKKSCIVEDSERSIIQYLRIVNPVKAIMGIYPDLGGCKIYDYSLQDTLNECLSDEVVYIYLKLLVNSKKKNRIEVLSPAGLLSLDELPINTDLIQRRHEKELFKLEMLICCMVAKFHWTLAIIKPDDKTIPYINPMGEPINSIKKEESKWNRYLQQRYGIIEKFKILTSPHAKQADSISCGVFCLKFAENYINGEELVTTFPIEEVNAYRKKVVQLLLDEGDKM